MEEELGTNKKNKRKGFFARFIEKVDKKMEEKARGNPCSCNPKVGNNSCCN